MNDPANIYHSAYALKMVNPTWSSRKISEMLEIDLKDLNQVHRVHLGVWKANKKLGTSGGYSIKEDEVEPIPVDEDYTGLNEALNDE